MMKRYRMQFVGFHAGAYEDPKGEWVKWAHHEEEKIRSAAIIGDLREQLNEQIKMRKELSSGLVERAVRRMEADIKQLRYECQALRQSNKRLSEELASIKETRPVVTVGRA